MTTPPRTSGTPATRTHARRGLRAVLGLALAATASLVATGAVGIMASPASASPVNCDGNGTSGKRVQLLYVRGSSQPNNLATYQAKMLEIPAQIDQEFKEAARRTGGPNAYRAVRWVTNASCIPTITSVVVPQALIDLDNDREGQMRIWFEANGYNSQDRKYVVWYERDACGLGVGDGQDDSPGATNINNRGSQFAFLGLGGCFWWGATGHELLHILGAVQYSAPHSTGWHCWDDQDIMCYNDGGVPNPPGSVQIICATAAGDTFAENQIDCNGDDYFNVNPAPGSYLATHWNVANNIFLIKTAPATPPTCTVHYSRTSDWGTGFNSDLTVTNKTSATMATWQLKFVFAGNQSIVSAWPGTWSQTGANVQLNSTTSLAAGASVHTFLNANYSGDNTAPVLFTLNNQICTTV